MGEELPKVIRVETNTTQTTQVFLDPTTQTQVSEMMKEAYNKAIDVTADKQPVKIMAEVLLRLFPQLSRVLQASRVQGRQSSTDEEELKEKMGQTRPPTDDELKKLEG